MAPRTATRHLTSPSFRVVSIDVGLRNLGLGIVRWLNAEDEAALRKAPVHGILRFERGGAEEEEAAAAAAAAAEEEEAAAAASAAAEEEEAAAAWGLRASPEGGPALAVPKRKRGRPAKAEGAATACTARPPSPCPCPDAAPKPPIPSQKEIRRLLGLAKTATLACGEPPSAPATPPPRQLPRTASFASAAHTAAPASEDMELEAGPSEATTFREPSAARPPSPPRAMPGRPRAKGAAAAKGAGRKASAPPPPDSLRLIKTRILVEHAENIDVLEENSCRAKNSKGVGPLRQVAFWHECMIRRAALLLDPPPDIVVVEVQDGGNATMRQVSTGIVGLFMGHFEALHRAGLIARVPEFAMIRGDMKLKVCRLIQGDPVADKSRAGKKVAAGAAPVSFASEVWPSEAKEAALPRGSCRGGAGAGAEGGSPLRPTPAEAVTEPDAASATAAAAAMATRAAALSVPEYLKRLNPRKYFALVRANEMEARARAEALRFGLLAGGAEEAAEAAGAGQEGEAAAAAAAAAGGGRGRAKKGAGRGGGRAARAREGRATLAQYGADPAAAPRSKTTGRNHSAYELRKRLAVASFERFMDEQLRERPHLICRELRDGWGRYTQKKRRDISDAVLQGIFIVTRHLALPLPA
jgi:hypothetical protein